MITTLADSNVLIDVISADAAWSDWSTRALAAAADRGTIVINTMIYVEVSIGFERIEDCDAAFDSAGLRRQPIPSPPAFLAAKAFLAYRKRGGMKQAPLPDSLIGAHASVCGLRLLTRDPARFRTYFPRVDLLSPQ